MPENEHVPVGWCFNAADFSMQAAGRSTEGRVTLIRDPANRELWHQQDEDTRDSDDCPPLYVFGFGATLKEALIDASKKALSAASVKLPNQQPDQTRDTNP